MKMISVNVKFFVFSILSIPEELIPGKKHSQFCICSFPRGRSVHNTTGFWTTAKYQVYQTCILCKCIAKDLLITFWPVNLSYVQRLLWRDEAPVIFNVLALLLFRLFFVPARLLQPDVEPGPSKTHCQQFVVEFVKKLVLSKQNLFQVVGVVLEKG